MKQFACCCGGRWSVRPATAWTTSSHRKLNPNEARALMQTPPRRGRRCEISSHPGWQPGERQKQMEYNRIPPKTQSSLQAAAVDGAAAALEKAAAELGTTPYWLRRGLQQHGLAVDAFADHRSLLKAVRQKRAGVKKAARELRDCAITVVIVETSDRFKFSQKSQRPGRADHLDATRRRDPELWRWNQEGPTQDPRTPQLIRHRNPTRTWRTNNGGTTQAAIDCTHKAHASSTEASHA